LIRTVIVYPSYSSYITGGYVRAMDESFRQARMSIGPERRFAVVAEDVTVFVKGTSGGSGVSGDANTSASSSSWVPLPLSNLLARATEQSYSAYRFKMTRLADGREIKFEVRSQRLRGPTIARRVGIVKVPGHARAWRPLVGWRRLLLPTAAAAMRQGLLAPGAGVLFGCGLCAAAITSHCFPCPTFLRCLAFFNACRLATPSCGTGTMACATARPSQTTASASPSRESTR
jgi:hypothetical protein